MNGQNRWWVMAIGLCMAAFGINVVYGQIVQWQLQARPNILWAAVLPAALIAVVGAVTLMIELLREADDPRPSLLGQALEPFVSAWLRLWTTKWLLWVYGSVAAVGVVGEIVQQILMLRYRHQVVPQEQPYVPVDVSKLLAQLPVLAHRAFEKFIPMFPSVTAPALVPIAVLVLAVWVLPRVIRLSREPRCEGKTAFFAFCVVLAVLSCGAVALAWVYGWRDTFLLVGRNHRLAQPDQRFVLLYREVAAIAAGVITSGALMGGILGSLARSKSREQNVKPTFLADAVRYFLPLAGFYLIVDLALTAPYIPYYVTPRGVTPFVGWLPMITTLVSAGLLLLMFAPFGIVARGLGVMPSIRHSCCVWKQTWRQAITLVVLGSFLRAIAMAPCQLLPLLFAKNSWLMVPVAAVDTLIGVAIRALITLALWEFYSANVRQQEHAPDMSP